MSIFSGLGMRGKATTTAPSSSLSENSWTSACACSWRAVIDTWTVDSKLEWLCKNIVFGYLHIVWFVARCYDYRPLAHHGNAANLEDKAKQIFFSGNWDLFSCKIILLFCPPDWLHSHGRARGLYPPLIYPAMHIPLELSSISVVHKNNKQTNKFEEKFECHSLRMTFSNYILYESKPNRRFPSCISPLFQSES